MWNDNQLWQCCRDVSELMMEQIDLFRYTRESIQRARAPGVPAPDMSSAAWDRALQQEMKAEGNLHPALCTTDGHYQVRARPSGLSK